MIRFYTTTIHPRSLSNELFKNYKKMTNYKETFFYTQQGIYKVEKGKLYKIIENNNKSILYNNIEGFDIIELTESNNKNNLIHVTSQLPCDYYVQRNDVTKYQLDNSTLVVVKTGEYFTDFYIEGDSRNNHITKDVISFLSRLN
ncbi:MAG: hypothetical protein CMI79_01675 [Candidatus Pelagibacter sp.]|nr:hypothetical protein [Candidatus Pelagibacter sp.]